MKNILIAEDSINKYKNIKSLLDKNNITYDSKPAKTYLECIERLTFNYDEYSAFILDMTLPRFKEEVTYKFAGYDILQRMKYEKLELPTIILTAYDTFTSGGEIIDLKDIVNNIYNLDPKIKVVAYNPGSNQWEKEILKFIQFIKGEDI